MISLSELAKKIALEKKVALFVHVRPDGDTIGSAFAFRLALNSLGITTDVFSEDAIPERFSYLKGYDNVIRNQVDFSTYSALIAIDCADVTRLGSFAKAFEEHKNTFVIDHHISNPRFAKCNYVVDNASNCENVFALIREMGATISEDIANYLGTGIVTDTGNFRHKSVTPFTFEVASSLKEFGADFNEIVYNNFNKQTKERAKLFGMVMSKIRYFYDNRFAVITITENDIKTAGATADQTEGFIDFIMGIDTVEVGASVMEISKNKYKISFRSKSANVNAVAGSFGGGGHVLASGCQISGEYEEVIDKISFAVSRELPEI